MRPGNHFIALTLTLFFLFSIFSPQQGKGANLLYELKLGVLDHDVSGLWTGYKLENGDDINAELVFSPSAAFLRGQLRANLGIALNTEGYTSKVYGGGVLEYSWLNGLFVDLGAGLAIHDGLLDEEERGGEKELGSRILFRFSLESGCTFKKHHRFSVMFDHVSNGYLAEPNEGIDTLGVRYGYLF